MAGWANWQSRLFQKQVFEGSTPSLVNIAVESWHCCRYKPFMAGSNSKKEDQLGMPSGTASNRLRKLILFDLASKLKLVVCFRCGEKIETAADFSIDHRIDWLDVDPDLFWDVENVVFSHFSCNISHGRRMERKVPHGTHTMYSHHGCRCLACTKAQREYQRKFNQKRRDRCS